MRVVIAGGGVAGLEAALALRELAGELVDVEIVAPEPVYWYRPMAVAEPFGLGRVQRLDLGRVAASVGATFVIGELGRVDAERRCAWTTKGALLEYDALVIACGARSERTVDGALTFRGPADTERFGRLLAELESGAIRILVFAVPNGFVWPLPLYELALLTSAFLATHGVDGCRLALVTPEAEPLELFGRAASAAVRALLDERGIDFRPRTTIDGDIAADRVVALPRLCGPTIEGVPTNGAGFIPIDEYGRVVGSDDVYAAGDATSFPIKHGGLAAQQADAVAESIAHDAGAAVTPSPFSPVLHGLLLTGGIPRYLQTSSPEVAVQPLWWPPTKIAARRLGRLLVGDAEAPGRRGAIPVELKIPRAPEVVRQ